MEAIELLKEATKSGALILVVDNKLKGKNLGNLDQKTRTQLRERKDEIIRLLLEPSVEPNLKPCCLCKGLNFIHGNQGGYFCTTCQSDVRPGDPVRAGGEQMQTKRGVKMKAIYEPKGAALEYADLALNHYLFCSHGCSYCFARMRMRKSFEQWKLYHEKKNVLADLEFDCRELAGDPRNVLLCFMSDPYQPCEADKLLTRRVLEIMQRHNVKPTILTKGGQLAQRDFDIMSSIPGSEFAVTLTTDNVEESLSWEPGAALPQERIDNLRAAHEQGIRTWVSFEPVINPEAVYRMIEQTHTFVDLFKIGKLNHDKRAHSTDWPAFREGVTALLDSLCCKYLVKKDLLVA